MKSKILVLTSLLVFLAPPAFAKVKVVATLADFADIAERVGGERVDVDWLVDGREDLHYVEILPSYMLKVKRAQVFLWAGLDLELWVPSIVEGARNRNLHIVDCSKDIEILEKPSGPVNPGMGDIHTSGNPHYWLDPRNGIHIARTIADELVAVDAEGTQYYLDRLASFTAAVNEKYEQWTATMQPHHGAEIVFFHSSWPYFNDAFGLVAAGFIEPKPGVSPSPLHTADIINVVKAKNIKVIASAPYFDHKVPESIARQTGATVVILAGGVGGIEGAEDYLSMFDANLARLRAALE